MAFCTSCGAQMEEGAAFCSKCGTQLVGEPGKTDELTKVEYEPPSKGATPRSRETRDPSGEKRNEAYLSGFSWAPGCWFYLFSRAMILFLIAYIIINMVVNGFMIGETVKMFVAAGIEGDEVPDELMEAVLRKTYTYGLIINFVGIAILIWAGKVGRRRRWEALSFQSFDDFKKNESAWSIAGIIGWILIVLGLISSLFSSVSTEEMMKIMSEIPKG